MSGIDWGRSLAAIGGAGALLVVLRTAVVGDVSRPNLEFLPEMVRGPAWQAQSDGAPVPGGLTSLALPEGVVPRGAEPFRYGSTPEEALRAGNELVNPFEGTDAAARARGAEVWGRFCIACHGPGGEGDGAVVRHGFPPPPSLLAARAREMKDGQMFHVVTRGQGNMASYAAHVPAADRWRAILHVRALQSGGGK